ncbi:ABC transporter permease [Fuchsiella alkaliacetigena]|uniref:ABC transporter permease n=1 Tax=Fuchsiella alkaliacetigena TaxID=957042 RepID=UPI00200B023F|nr:iron ABC transporter permease [Fuchsiella alkaliacetigena]MCK8826096.1 iron ABC transporter permease [Fuchsiella alkaliacetigena]
MQSKLSTLGNKMNLIKNGQLTWPFSAPAFILIPVIIIALAMSLPLFYLIIRVWGAEDFLSLLLREQTLTVLLNTLALAGAVTVATIVIAVPLAWLTVRTDLPGRRIWSILTMVPLVIPSLVGGFAFVSAFGYGGIVHNFISDLLNITYTPGIYGFFGAWAVLTLLSYPYVLLSVRSALLGMEPSQEEAARTLGQTPWQTFWKVTLPKLRPAIGAGGLLVALYTLSDFAAVSLLQFDSFTRVIFLQYRGSFNRIYAAVLALVLVVLTMLIVSAEMWTRGKARYHSVGRGTKGKLMKVKLGPWKWPAFIFCLLIVLLALVLPVGVCIFWLVRGLIHGEAFVFRWEAAFNSFYAAGIAAVVGVIATLPVAILSVRYKSKLSGVLEKVAYAGYALPGIVVALSLVFFGSNYATSFYQTLPLLIFAYVILFLPQAMGVLRSSLLQVGPNVEDAALTMGCSKLKVLWSVVIPLIRPGILTGAALIFLTTMKELPATLLLSPIGFRSLTTEIWNATTEAFYTRAAVPALLLVIISLFSLAVLFAQEDREKNRG